MGSDSSKEKCIDLKAYQFYKEIDDNNYGHIQMYKLDDSYFAYSKRTFTDKRVFDSILGFIEEEHIHPNLVQRVDWGFRASQGICGHFWSLEVLHEYFWLSLDADLQYHRMSGKKYLEEELFYIAKSVLLALESLANEHRFHANISPESILLNDSGEIKTVDHISLLKEENPHNKYLHGFDGKLYLAPKIFKKIVEDRCLPECENTKDDVFSLGLVLLECCLLDSFQEIFLNRQFNVELLEHLLDKVEQEYSQKFVDFLRKMLIVDETNRNDIKALLKNIEQLQRSEVKIANNLNLNKETKVNLNKNEVVQPQEEEDHHRKEHIKKAGRSQPPKQEENHNEDMNFNFNINYEAPNNLNISNENLEQRLETVLQQSKRALERYSSPKRETDYQFNLDYNKEPTNINFNYGETTNFSYNPPNFDYKPTDFGKNDYTAPIGFENYQKENVHKHTELVKKSGRPADIGIDKKEHFDTNFDTNYGKTNVYSTFDTNYGKGNFDTNFGKTDYGYSQPLNYNFGDNNKYDVSMSKNDYLNKDYTLSKNEFLNLNKDYNAPTGSYNFSSNFGTTTNNEFSYNQPSNFGASTNLNLDYKPYDHQQATTSYTYTQPTKLEANPNFEFSYLNKY